MTASNEPVEIKTEDGYTFYRLPDGRYADRLLEEKIDMSWPDYKAISKSFHDKKISFTAYFE